MFEENVFIWKNINVGSLGFKAAAWRPWKSATEEREGIRSIERETGGVTGGLFNPSHKHFRKIPTHTILLYKILK